MRLGDRVFGSARAGVLCHAAAMAADTDPWPDAVTVSTYGTLDDTLADAVGALHRTGA